MTSHRLSSTFPFGPRKTGQAVRLNKLWPASNLCYRDGEIGWLKNAFLEPLNMKVLKPLTAVVLSLVTFSSVKAQHHSTDTLTMSNYRQPGALIMGLGDQFNGFMIQYRVCDIWGVPAISGTVDWGDQAAPTSIFFDTLNTGRAGTIKTPQKAGTFTVKATISATCDDAWQHKHANNEVSGTATAYVYDSIPIVSFIVTCGGSSPCMRIPVMSISIPG